MGLKNEDVFAQLPDSLRHESFEMQDIKEVLPPPPKYDSAGDVTPYLGLRARLSQVWMNRWTILLLVVLARVLMLLSDLHDNIGSAETEALSACTKVEDVGSAMASMPHYLSVGVNDLAASGITKAVQGVVELLLLVLEGVEQLILFVLEMYIGTYVCLSTALVHGALDVGIGAADAVTDVMNEAIDTITGSISSDLSSIQDTINDVFDEIASAASVFGDSVTAPTINLTSYLNDLKNISVDDTAFVSTLASLNASIPTYDDVKELAAEALSIPFAAVSTELNNTYGSYVFDASAFPVAQKQALTFCSDNTVISDFFDSLYALAATARRILIGVLVALAALACVPLGWLEVRRFRRQQQRARVLTAQGYDSMDVVYMASRPLTAGVGVWLASRWTWARASAKRQLLVRWTVAYATSVPALFVLALALAGLVSCACQAALLRAVQAEAPALATEVGDFADEVVATLANVSQTWADDANGVLGELQDRVNGDLLDYVANATAAANNTLNVFSDEMDSAIAAVFNGTVLYNTVQQVVMCLIGYKIDTIEQGLTWVHDHAHVTLPQFAPDIFSVGANESLTSDSGLGTFLASANSVTTDDVDAAVDKVVARLRSSLIEEALLSGALLLVYVIVVLAGIVRAAMRLMQRDRSRAEGGQRWCAEGVTGATVQDVQAQMGQEVREVRGMQMAPPMAAVVGRQMVYNPFADPSPSPVDVKPQRVATGRGEVRSHWRSSSHGSLEHVDVDAKGR